MTNLANFLHRLAHWLDPSPCRCAIAAYTRAWEVRRDAELRRVARSPAALDEQQWRQWLAEREAA